MPTTKFHFLEPRPGEAGSRRNLSVLSLVCGLHAEETHTLTWALATRLHFCFVATPEILLLFSVLAVMSGQSHPFSVPQVPHLQSEIIRTLPGNRQAVLILVKCNENIRCLVGRAKPFLQKFKVRGKGEPTSLNYRKVQKLRVSLPHCASTGKSIGTTYFSCNALHVIISHPFLVLEGIRHLLILNPFGGGTFQKSTDLGRKKERDMGRESEIWVS